MLTKRFMIIVGIAALSLSSGCGKPFYAQNETPLDRNWGRSIEAAKYSQIFNPDAQISTAPVAGLRGEAAKRNLEKYDTSFEQKPPKPSYRISFGGIGGK